MQRPAHIWITFAACLAVVLGAMAWISVTVLRLEHAEVQAQRQAEREENVRLALWRIDSALAPIMATENARPYFVYQSFYPLDRTFGNMFANGGSVLMPSPLLTQPIPPTLLHFQIEPDGTVTSPQVPAKETVALAEQLYSTQDNLRVSNERLQELKGFINKDVLLSVLPREVTPEGVPIRMMSSTKGTVSKEVLKDDPDKNAQPLNGDNNNSAWANGANANKDNDYSVKGGSRSNRQQPDWQQAKSSIEQRNRVKSYENWNQQEKETQKQQLTQQVLNDVACFTNNLPQIGSPNPLSPLLNNGQHQGRALQSEQTFQEDILPAAPGNVPKLTIQTNAINPGNLGATFLQMPDLLSHVSEGMTKPVWFGEKLIVARRCQVKNQLYVQGCWLDWPSVAGWLTEEINDLLPFARLEPVLSASTEKQAYMMAALPVRLVPGVLPIELNDEFSPLRLSLVIAWICVLLAAAAVAALLLGAVSLSERRGAFVSSVTHELRTPLTTFRMYTEMLSTGMVPDEAQRQNYLNTLRVEAERLSHLVENVLAYARLERGRPGSRLDSVSLKVLLENVTGRLPERAAQAGMTLHIEPFAENLSTQRVKTDPSAIEQIVFNLVDNACKYAAHAAQPAIHMSAKVNGRFVEWRVRDFGPGLAKQECRNLFQPFSKTAREAAHSAPGVGLGLALSRRLAREMGGDLHLDTTVTDGACFVLAMPIASQAY